MRDLNIRKCDHCKNIIGFIDDKGVPVMCCGEKMKEVVANSTEAATEKHVPVVTVESGKVKINVGSVSHPMEDAHLIEWVAVTTDNSTERVALKAGDAPIVELTYKGPGTAYAYCNLHGLWKADIE